jgi:ABC-type Fe3+ transport system substrate-binding protein
MELDGSEKAVALAERMYPSLRECLSRDGHLVALPVTMNAWTIGINEKALEALGLKLEDVPENWSDFLDFVSGLGDKLAENKVMRESGSTAIAKLQSGECAAIMILEESVLKYIDDEAQNGNEVANIKVIYPEDGVILIPSTVMIVAEEYSKNVNTEAAEAVARWLLTEDAQKLIMQGYMHSVLKGSDAYPKNSIPTDDLIARDLGVDWEKAYKDREEINNLWTEKITQ